jgi:hypothetical protein
MMTASNEAANTKLMPVMTTAALSGADTPASPCRVGSAPNQPGVIGLPAISQKVKLRTEFRSTI